MPEDILFLGILYFTNSEFTHEIANRLKPQIQRFPLPEQQAFALLCMVFYYMAGARILHKSELQLLQKPHEFNDLLEQLVLQNNVQIRPWHRKFGKELTGLLFTPEKRVILLEKAVKLAVKDGHLKTTLEEMLYKTKEGGNFSMLVTDHMEDCERLLETAANSFQDEASLVHYAIFLYRHKQNFEKAVEIMSKGKHCFRPTASFFCTFGDVYRNWYKHGKMLECKEHASYAANYYRHSLSLRKNNSHAVLGYLKIVAYAISFLPDKFPSYSYTADAAALYLHSTYFEHQKNFRETLEKLPIPASVITLATVPEERRKVLGTIYEFSLLGLQHIVEDQNLSNEEKSKRCVDLAVKGAIDYLSGGFHQASYFLHTYFHFLDLLEGKRENEFYSALNNFRYIHKVPQDRESYCQFRTLYVNLVDGKLMIHNRMTLPLVLTQCDNSILFRDRPLPDVVECKSVGANGLFSGWIVIKVKGGNITFALAPATFDTN